MYSPLLAILRLSSPSIGQSIYNIMSIQRLLRHLRNSFLNLGRTLTRPISNFIQRGLRSLFQIGRQRQAGFVLPTVTMVILVVSLLSLAMLLRSTDRAKNAHNFRVNEATLNATAPALDRAKAKIAAVFEDPNIPRGTPSDTAFMGAFGGLGNGIENYTFGDEVPLKLVFDIDGDNNTGEEDSGAAKNTKNDETVNTAWKFPVDTDNNGKFDSYTLYTILFRNPTTSGGEFTRARNPLEARNLPMEGASGSACANNTGGGASLVGDSDWFQLPNEQKLKKAFFVYAATVPIGPNTSGALPTGLDANEYELFPGGAKGFSALEYQQDWSRIPLANNAVVYQDDLLMFAGTAQRFNGRIMTNANLMVGSKSDNNNATVYYYLVSSPNSCFYDEESSKIIVGGNVGDTRYDDFATKAVDEIHLFRGEGNNPTTSNGVQTTFGTGTVTSTVEGTGTNNNRDSLSLYNNNAYNQRIAFLVNAAVQLGSSYYPDDLPASSSTAEVQRYYESYFKKLTRQVPYIEVPSGKNALYIPTEANTGGLFDGGFLKDISNTTQAENFFKLYRTGEPDTSGVKPLRPPTPWMFPVDPGNNDTTYMVSQASANNKLSLNLNQIAATNPEEREGKEWNIGDRVLVGNNLPETVYDFNSGVFVSGESVNQEVQGSSGVEKWFKKNGTADPAEDTRIRDSQVVSLPDLGDVARDGQWEIDAATAPQDKFDNVGGLRIVTGTGIYLPGSSTVSSPPTANTTNTVIWPDYFPVAKNHSEVVVDTSRPYLRMRASVVYHHSNSAFADNSYTEADNGDKTHQTPLACVANYYDPTDATSDSNNSENGVVYNWNQGSFNLSLLRYQAELRYPGVVYQEGSDVVGDRRVNPLLKDALDKSTSYSSTARTIAEQSAVDAAVCATYILGSPTASTAIPADAIKEVTFLDGRQIKANDVHSLQVTGGAGGTYTLVAGMPNPALEVDDLVTIEEHTVSTSPPTETNTPKIVRGKVTAISGDNITVSTSTTESVYASGTPDIDTGDGTTGWITETLSSRYDLSIDERYPLEIRATQIDLEKLRTTRRGSFNDPQEYLLPNSGIIYATREDALPDQTVWVKDGNETTDRNRTGGAEPDLGQSSTDFKLDPTRRPNAILLVNGSQLNRGNNNDYRAEEKGFILATDLPVYIKGDFNLHSAGQEFDTDLDATYSNFYTRSTLNDSFACRKNQPGGCDGDGDTWRSATVFADALTLLSDDFKFGYRHDGDYDLNNNQGDARSIAKRRQNGFYTNALVINGDYANLDTDHYDYDNYTVTTGTKTFSSYLNNFVTPVQRRASFAEYVMEICEKLPVSECEADDWHILYDADLDGALSGTIDESTFLSQNLDDFKVENTSGTDQTIAIEEQTFSLDIVDNSGNPSPDNSINAGSKTLTIAAGATFTPTAIGIDLDGDGSIGNVVESSIKLKASELPFLDRYTGTITKGHLLSGTTGRPAINGYTHYPRRIAFLRDSENKLLLDNTERNPVALGIDGADGDDDNNNEEVHYYSYNLLQDDDDIQPGKYGLLLQTLKPTSPFELIGQPDNSTNVKHTLNLDSHNGKLPRKHNQALWFRSTLIDRKGSNTEAPTDTDTWKYTQSRPLAFVSPLQGNVNEQPLLIPVLQIHTPNASPSSGPSSQEKSFALNDRNNNKTSDDGEAVLNGNSQNFETDWVQHANSAGTTFNLVFVAGDSPGRPGELNRSIGNFPRFLEDWDSADVAASITGSFIQKGRSVYATGPTDALLNRSTTSTDVAARHGIIGKDNVGLFHEPQIYATDVANGILPFYNAPERPWGFDVALLTQAPDLFAQRFAIQDDTPPNEFYREVRRDDQWVENLLCAGQPDKRLDPANSNNTVAQQGGYDDAGDPYDKDVKIANNASVSYQYAISKDQRPNTCQ